MISGRESRPGGRCHIGFDSHLWERRPRRDSFAVVALVTIVFGPVFAQLPARSTWDGVYTVEQAERGELGYAVECVSCHGPQLEGMDAAPALVGGRFMSTWNGVTLADMLNRTRITMPLEDPGKMSRQQIADVLAYLLRENGFPAGEGELPRQTAILRGISFDGGRR